MKPPSDPADHAVDFARRYWRELDEYCVLRMNELGIPPWKNGERDPDRPGVWRAFVPEERTGGHVSSGITVNSGVLNPTLLGDGLAGRIWARSRLRDRIDAVIAHEYEEDVLGSHSAALVAGPSTELPITEQARRILHALAAGPGGPHRE